VEKAPVEHAPVEHAPIEGLHAKIGGHASNATGAAGVALALAEGRYREAGQSAALQVALNPATYKAAAELTKDVAPVAKGLGFVGKKIPVIGALVTAGFVLYEVGGDVYDHKYGKAGAALGAGAAEALGNVVGFGVGDLAREGVRAGVVYAAGEQYAPDKSGLRQLGEGAYALAKKELDGKKPEAKAEPKQEPKQQSRPEPPKSAPPPSIYNYKNLPVVGFVLKDTPNTALNGKPVRTPDGFIKNLRDIDMSDPKNLRAFEDAIQRRMKSNEKIIDAGKPKYEMKAVSNFIGMRDGDRKVEDAKVEVRQLQGALREIEMFKKEVEERKGVGPAAPKKDGADSKFHSGQGGKSAVAPAEGETKTIEKPRHITKPAAPRI
jgi:hypothetical protein